MEAKVVVRRYAEAVDSDRGSLRFVDTWLTPDFKCHAPGSTEPLDVAAFKEMVRPFFAGFSDMRHEILHLVAEGEFVALTTRLSLVHTGEFMGVKPTGRRVVVDEMGLFRVRDGRIAEEWFVYDSAALLQQIGGTVAPTVAAGGR